MAGLRRLARFISLIPACLLALPASHAAAQANASEKAAAEALFDQGVRLMRQNNFGDACPKLEESNRIDPAVGTLLYLGECFERVGKTASAWATFREAASLASNYNQPDRARTAATRAQELEPKLSRLSIELSPDVARIPGVTVKRGLRRLEPSVYGTPLPVDPGDYRVEVSAPGYEVWTAPISVAPGGSASVRVPGLVKSAEPPPENVPPPAALNPSSPPNSPALPPAAPASRSLSGQQVAGLVAGSVGLVGVGIGSFFGVRAISRNSDAEKHCPTSGLCNNQTGLDLTDDARKDAKISNIAFIAGGVLVATGTVLYLTGGSDKADRVALTPLVGPNLAAASVAGRF